MPYLMYLYRQSRMLLLVATLAGLVCGIAGALLAVLISNGLQGRAIGTMAAVAFFGLCALILISKTASEMALIRLTQRAIYRMRIRLSHQLLATPQRKLQELGRHGLTTILTRDVEVFTMAFEYLPVAFNNGVVILGCMAYLAWVSWPVFLMITLLIVVGIYGFHMAEREPIRQLAAARDQVDLLYQHFYHLIDGSRELQLNAQRGKHFVEKVLEPDAAAFCALSTSSLNRYMWVTNLGGMTFYVVMGLMLFVVPMVWPQTSGVLISVTLVLLYLIKPIFELLIALPRIRNAVISLGRIQYIASELESGEGTEDQPASPFAAERALALELKEVVHRYPGDLEDETFRLGPVNFRVKQGETVFVIGGNGGGKTTLAMLLLGLYPPDSGKILLNGQAVTPDNAQAYRQHFSAIFSDFHLFEQLLLADDGQLGQRAQHYLQRLGISHKVALKEGGQFSTIKLSQGQRKRLALVAAYLEDRPIYLFDEWAADQDPRSKHVFYTELLPELKARGKAVIVITHDDAYFSCADRIVKLNDGELHPVTSHELPTAMA
ncbi:cyclic peptide export ABC transporter [Leeia sp.]|uniref:cyclic peptide export ABC transporter n=1 Tax=Leeia sp. TaxID=2884678 RepID=UPI0035AF0B4A